MVGGAVRLRRPAIPSPIVTGSADTPPSDADMRSEVDRWRAKAIDLRGELISVRASAFQAHAEVATEREASRSRSETLEAVLNTVSWRITKPLRFVRRFRSRVGRDVPVPATSAASPAHSTDMIDDSLLRRFRERVWVVTTLLDPEPAAQPQSLGQIILAFEHAVDHSSESAMTKAWLALVSIFGEYQEEPALENAARICRLRGGHGLAELMLESLEGAKPDAAAVDSELEVVRDGVLVDVSETAGHDLHTGIQRVVRELASRWLSDGRAEVVHWNFWTSSVKRLSDDEADRLRNWRSYLHEPGAEVQSRALAERTGKTVIPWHAVLVLPELIVSPRTCSGYRALARSGVIRRCSMIGYDSVPMTAAETVTVGMTANFGHYLALVKHASHLSAISEAATGEFRAFAQMLRSQGLPGPTLTARPLPTTPPEISDGDLEEARLEFGASSLPVVVVVGSHEPRKNHLVVLEAAETMWRSGQRFDLIFAGGSSWGGSEFDIYLEELAAEGFPVRRYARVAENSLWALYRLARFSVFPSLLEGYGLPIAESLASGTPVITSNYGSMAEIGHGGGAVLVDPRDSVALASAMSSLLDDNELWNRLVSEARSRVFPTWDEYSESVWIDLIGSTTT
jgi:glycosyltransferase involved in cell wall biosynthesis